MFRFIKKNYLNNLNECVKFIDTKKPVFYCAMLFDKNSPTSTKGKELLNQFKNKNGYVETIEIDYSDDFKIRNYYRLKGDIEFIFCYYGKEYSRVIGLNLNNMNNEFEKILENVNSDKIPVELLQYESFNDDSIQEKELMHKDFYNLHN